MTMEGITGEPTLDRRPLALPLEGEGIARFNSVRVQNTRKAGS